MSEEGSSGGSNKVGVSAIAGAGGGITTAVGSGSIVMGGVIGIFIFVVFLMTLMLTSR